MMASYSVQFVLLALCCTPGQPAVPITKSKSPTVCSHSPVGANMADCKESNEASKDPEPPVTMKFDSPEESSDNSANDEAEKPVTEKDSDNSSSSSSMTNSTSLSERQSSEANSKKRMVPKSFGRDHWSPDLYSGSSKPKSALLRPSQLNAVTTNSSSTTTKSVLKPAKFQNPFTKVTDIDDVESASSTQNTKDQDTSKDSDKEEKDKQSDEQKEDKEKEAPKFLALNKTKETKENENILNSTMAASASTPSFVFGQNLKERVAVAHDADSSDGSEKEEPKEEPANENGSSELMFSNAAAVCRSTAKPGLTLSQAAQEMEEANRANKRKYSEVTLLTGEEDETNVLQINCKLFAFDKATSSYQERGRGSLRLNDKDEESRLVGRAAGTQRLVLNTKVWPGMTVERAGPKSLRLTAMDVQGDIRIFVVQAAQKEVEQLHNLLMQRLKRAQDRQPKKVAAEPH
ncbi:ran-binding protein 3 isoform X3 [Nasonia vitripennis]|uniref:RanBD1 domain-containing protein n=2 Tax=Nasonia vitripennis TaxID=7425 RepID=A0A7M7LJZ3_NASVI|nr:ran-binding protein 3 isoform X3 [Nasonia vitripennis]